MPAQSSQSKLMSKYGNRLSKAYKEHKDDEIRMGGFEQLPPGIANGVAKLTKCVIEVLPNDTKATKADGSSAKGEEQLRIVGQCVEPNSVFVNGQEVACRDVSTNFWPIPLYDSKRNTFEQNVADAINELKKLGADFSEADDAAALIQAVADLQESKPYFRFRTSVKPALEKGKPDGVWENLIGVRGLEGYVQPESNGVADRTGGGGQAQTWGTQPEEQYDDQSDIRDLLKRAEAQDEKAMDRLREMAKNVGYSDEDVDGAADWAAVVELINNPTFPAGGSEAPEEPAEFEPAKEVVYKFTPRDAKGQPTKDKSKRPVVKEGECVSVDKRAKTVTLRDNADKKTLYKSVPWADLSE